ncbi:MAG: hypothetical protein R3E32_25330 [Chitinophagales bacterium]
MNFSKMLNQTTGIIFRLTAFVYLLSCNFLVFAQDGDKGLDIDVDIGGGDEAVWYTNPMIWVIVGLFVIVIVAISTRGKK